MMVRRYLNLSGVLGLLTGCGDGGQQKPEPLGKAAYTLKADDFAENTDDEGPVLGKRHITLIWRQLFWRGRLLYDTNAAEICHSSHAVC